jgi:hypothetical protein
MPLNPTYFILLYCFYNIGQCCDIWNNLHYYKENEFLENLYNIFIYTSICGVLLMMFFSFIRLFIKIYENLRITIEDYVIVFIMIPFLFTILWVQVAITHFLKDSANVSILSNIAKDPNFKNKEGKFDNETFKKFLAKNGLDEERYFSEIANDVKATMILQTLSMASPLNYQEVIERENFKQEKRLADVATISVKNAENVPTPKEEELQKFFEENKQSFNSPEMRQVSYVYFSTKDLCFLILFYFFQSTINRINSNSTNCSNTNFTPI